MAGARSGASLNFPEVAVLAWPKHWRCARDETECMFRGQARHEGKGESRRVLAGSAPVMAAGCK